jgi:DNA-directed RNA polymerase subunit RPC12/RpoP
MTTTPMAKVAHDSGDGMTVYHCPFCGSGQVLARSDRTIECEFCHTAFTVQVQPEFSAFPQTVDGAPMEVPGMPGQIDGPGAQAGPPVDPGAVGPDGQLAPGDPMASDADATEENEEGEEDDPDVGANPFTSARKYQTAEGAWLDEENYLAYIAIQVAPDRKAAAAAVKAARKR